MHILVSNRPSSSASASENESWRAWRVGWLSEQIENTMIQPKATEPDARDAAQRRLSMISVALKRARGILLSAPHNATKTATRAKNARESWNLPWTGTNGTRGLQERFEPARRWMRRPQQLAANDGYTRAPFSLPDF
jgi:hypothetical protein